MYVWFFFYVLNKIEITALLLPALSHAKIKDKIYAFKTVFIVFA